ncbi:MAG TPA: kdo(2)-lipid A phosphoethanolamine 7''-transferase [Burkholderiaceae bacterium]|nr:kdo(2)-lipid A phosphoethanolamine 7''-transferase [Burkholderiaceae bacterium]
MTKWKSNCVDWVPRLSELKTKKVIPPKRWLLAPWQAVLLLSVYIGIVLNGAVFAKRFTEMGQSSQGAGWIFAELVLVFAFTALLLSLLDLTGKWIARTAITLLLIISVLASYYMSIFNVVIGYGVVQAVLTTDVDLSKEAVGVGLMVWFATLALVPLLLWWRYVHVVRQSSVAGSARIKQLTVRLVFALIFAGIVAVLAQRMNSSQSGQISVGQDIGQANLVAHSYVPSNWVAGLGMSVSSAWDEWRSASTKNDPAKQFAYDWSTDNKDVYVVMVIGESARSGNFGLLGYDRPTTPLLAKTKNLVAFNGTSCNTSTKLSLQCMFVRPTAVVDRGMQAPQILEDTVFSVFRKLGFTTELFAMQSELWFYNSLKPNHYKIREVIAAEDANRNQPALDSFLESELATSLTKHPQGRHIVVLHTKGSHFNYTSRYPREFAQYQPECEGVDGACTKAQLINSYDNSILYTDAFLHRIMTSLADKKAMVIYTSDHGESIDENRHFHATPKPLAPIEQLQVPLLFWASDAYLANPARQKAFSQLRAAAKLPHAGVGHANLFDSMLGCLGVTSANGGIDDKYNLCH